MKDLIVRTQNQYLTFSGACGGFPSSLMVTEADGCKTQLWHTGKPMLSLKTGDGRLLRPILSGAVRPSLYREGENKVLEFSRIPWIDAETGSPQKDLFLSLKWEIHKDGAVFCNLFLFYSTLEVPVLQDLKLELPLDFSGFDDLHWSAAPFPESLDATIIQAAPPERFISGSESRCYDSRLMADFSFNAARRHGPALYFECFLEGCNTLFNRQGARACSEMQAGRKNMRTIWNFQKNPMSGNGRPLHWRNRWGFCCRPAQTLRRHPPMTIYHYIDNFQRMPGAGQIRALADAGAQVLILHDCWRFDTQNNGIPYEEAGFRRAVRALHREGIRIALYARGNELSVREDAAPWFDQWLQRNFDGLYVDYGSPLGYFMSPDENYPGGRIAFREYYKAFAALRERVGSGGLLFVHTGPGYSGLAAGFFDSYVSGEGERGILIRGRAEHEYFTMAAVSPGTIWTAAFPEYASPKMIPFMAADGEAPHIPLGCQISSSSLEHPPVPGISDQAFIPLLQCYAVMKNRQSIRCFTDYNSRGIFSPEDEAAHTLILSNSGKYGIMLLANCSDRTVPAAFRILSPKFSGLEFHQLPEQPDPDTLTELAPWQTAGALITTDRQTARRILRRLAPHGSKAAAPGKEYQKTTLLQAAFRNAAPPCRRCCLEVFMPSRITSHEQSLWDDLYDIVITLREKLPGGKFRRLGYVGKDGLTENLPQEDSRLRPGELSASIPLHELLPSGKHDLQLYSEHLGEPFYSFVTARLTLDSNPVQEIRFRNELESDRSILHWKINLQQS